jgi:hypothetical protein
VQEADLCAMCFAVYLLRNVMMALWQVDSLYTMRNHVSLLIDVEFIKYKTCFNCPIIMAARGTGFCISTQA